MTAALSTFFLPSAGSRIAAWAKFRCRKIHASEKTARVILLCTYAFLVRYTVFGCIDQILSRTNDSDNREYSKGYGNITSVILTKCSGKSGYNMIGHVTARAAANGLFAMLFYFYIKNYRVNYLYYSNRCVLC